MLKPIFDLSYLGLEMIERVSKFLERILGCLELVLESVKYIILKHVSAKLFV